MTNENLPIKNDWPLFAEDTKFRLERSEKSMVYNYFQPSILILNKMERLDLNKATILSKLY